MSIRDPRRGHGDLEQEILDVLVIAGQPLTPAAVRERLPGDLAYNTVTTVLGRLHEKGRVTRDLQGRAYAYLPVQEQAQITAFQMSRLLSDEADRAAVLARFVSTLSPADEAFLVGLLNRDGEDPETADQR
ncbi:MAG TPA: BlaI/MecI/CopY family transcriptional regulator [Rugosimonospora sp.]